MRIDRKIKMVDQMRVDRMLVGDPKLSINRKTFARKIVNLDQKK